MFNLYQIIPPYLHPSSSKHHQFVVSTPINWPWVKTYQPCGCLGMTINLQVHKARVQGAMTHPTPWQAIKVIDDEGQVDRSLKTLMRFHRAEWLSFHGAIRAQDVPGLRLVPWADRGNPGCLGKLQKGNGLGLN